jgi:membrane protein YdbS with pleckstrin-like domain
MSIWPLILGIVNENISNITIAVAMIMVVDILLVLPIYFFTSYTLEETALHIQSGLCVNKRIAYKDIEDIKETRSPLASAGLSLDRISIAYANGEVLISPKNKQEFIRLLKQKM